MARPVEENLSDLIARVNTVRKWLVALAILKVTAFCVLFIVVYIVGYSILDHHLHFGMLGRAVALVLLLGALASLLYGLVRVLMVHISYSGAANYIEQKENLDQRLVAAVEYYENRDDYPYSKTLAEQLVVNVCRITQGRSFNSTVNKWHGYVLGGITLVGLAILGLFAGRNLAHIRPYFARLAMPLAAIEPVSSTSLSPITGDIVAEPDSVAEFAALIEGRAPESGKLVVVPVQEQVDDADELPLLQETVVRPVTAANEQSHFEATQLFPETGQFQYRFEAGSAATPWQSVRICDPPAVERITAQVSLPNDTLKENRLEPYTVTVENNAIELVKGSRVKVSVKASGPLKEMSVTGPDGKEVTAKREGSDFFSFEFKADSGGTLGLKLLSEDGLANREPADLEVTIKTDKPPEFKLLSPDGDYLATNVSSVPILFEITDDFGLESAELVLEFPNGEPRTITSNLPDQAKNTTCSTDLELEEYNLNVGDSILFYARATDIDTGLVVRDRSTAGEVYFIEIRQYKQFLHPKEGGGSGQGGGGPAEDLLTILEYTRAAIKKTWAIAQKATPTSDDISRLNSIGDDIEYCAAQVTEIRDDPEIGFGEQQKAVLDEVLAYYEQAVGHLRGHRTVPALASEKDAYRVLRKFVDELNIEWSPPSTGGGQQPKKPDAVKLKESPAFLGYEKERIEAELKKVQQQVEKLKEDQKALKTDFENFLNQQAKERSTRQAAAAEAANKSKASDSSSKDSSQTRSGSAQNSQSQADSGNEQSQQSAGSQSASSSASQGKSQGQGSSASQQGTETSESSHSTGQGGGKSQSQTGNASKQPSESQQASASSTQGNGKSQGQGKSPSQQSADGRESAESSDQSGGESKGQGAQQGRQEGSSGQSGRGQESSETSQAQAEGQGKAGSQGRQDSASRPGDSNQQSAADTGTPGSSGQDASGDQSRGQASSESNRSDPAAEEARLRMFQARQRQLQDTAQRLKQQLQQMPQGPSSSASQASQQAQDHLDKAVSKMEDFQKKVDQSRYEPASGSKATEAAELMDSAEEQLAKAEDMLGRGTATSQADEQARQARKMAEQLAEDADALDKSLSPVEQQEMRARLEAARELLKKMAPAQWVQMQKGGGGSSSGLVYTMDSHAAAAETARAISREFWSIALEARKAKQKTIETESSDVKFREAEIEFFKKAAKYGQRNPQK